MSALTDLFTSLANKIRSKLGTTSKYTPAQAISAIDDVYDKGVADGATPTQEKTATAGTSAITVTPDSGYALSKVTVNPTPSQTKSATPSTSAQTISPDNGKLLSSVTVNAISPQRNLGTAATGSGIDSTGPYVYIPYGWWKEYGGKAGSSYTYMTAAQAVAACPKQEKTITATTSAQSVTPDSGKLLSKVTVNAQSHSGTYTFPANDTGGTKDLTATHTYRYVNATNVYNKGKADGTSASSLTRGQYYGKYEQNVARKITGVTVGSVVVICADSPTFFNSVSGGTIIGSLYNSGTGQFIGCYKATATTVSTTSATGACYLVEVKKA